MYRPGLTVACGVLPAAHAARQNLRTALAAGGRSASGGSRSMKALIGAEVTIAFVLLTGAGEKSFCAGADLGASMQGGGRVQHHDARGRMGELLLAVVNLPKPLGV